MPRLPFTRNLLRADSDDDVSRVTYFELFFDLVFVYAITEVTHIVLDSPGWVHLLQAAMLTVVVWWVWVFTAWVTNWLHPDRGPVRALLIVLMGLGLLWATAIPEAFDAKAPLFAILLVTMNVGRSAFTIGAFSGHPDHALNFTRITTWFAASGVLWIAGAFAPGEARIVLWLIAFAIDCAGPRCFFWVPGLGRSRAEAWDITGEHMAERVSLFLIIALGESIIETGQGFVEQELGAATIAAFLAAFAGTVLMWFLYFNHAQQHASEYIEETDDTGMVAQTGFTYAPVPLALGIIVTAIGNGLVLEHPTGPAEPWAAGLLSIGASVYLVGNAMFKRVTGGRWLMSHLLGVVAFAALYLLHPWLSAVVLSWIGDAVLLLTVLADDLLYRRVERQRADERRPDGLPDSLEG
ncbi:MAG TPA: low temperature requirement protein A [Gryllotalpicola sp.]